MPFYFRTLEVKEWSKMFGPFIGALLSGGLIRRFYPAAWSSSTTFYALADALMVAGIIGGLLEVFSARLMIERVSRDLAEELVGRGLPKELRQHIHKITRTKLVWSNNVKRYRLSLVQDRMLLELDGTSEIRNYSDSKEEYSPKNMEEAFYDPEFLRIEYGLDGDTPGVFTGNKLKTEVIEGRVKKTCDLPKIDIPVDSEGRFVQVHHVWRMTMPLEYTDVTYFGGPAIGLTIILEQIPDGFDFSATGESVVHAEDSKSWFFPGPFIQGQHVRVRWFKKPSQD